MPIRFPALGARSVQFSYQNGYINAIEVMVVDSLGHHQAYLVCRNSTILGNQGGQVNLLFDNIAPGTAWVTVRTTYKQFIGPNARLQAVSGLPSTYTLDGATSKLAVQGDVNSAVVVFDSMDLGGTATNPSVLSFYSNNDGANELNDTSTTNAGYGVGASSASVVANGTNPLYVSVSQPPSFGAPMNLRQADAGGAVTISASNVLPNDQVVVVRSGSPSATNDFLDRSKIRTYDYYPLTSNGNGTYTFIPTHATNGIVNYYLARGEAVSLIGGSTSSVQLAQINVHPAAVYPSNCTARSGSDDGSSMFARSPAQTDTLYLTLRDQYGNAITDGHFGARAMERYVWYSTVEPLSASLNNGLNNQAFIPGSTLGLVTMPSYNASDNTWHATFTQGALAATGATPSFAMASNTNIMGLRYLYDPSNLGSTTNYVLGVVADPTLASTPQRLWLSLYRGTAVNTGIFVASASYQPSAVPAAAGATISITPNTPNGYPLVLKLLLNPNSELSTVDHGTRFTVTQGARSVGDTDKAIFRLYQQNADGSLNLRGAIPGGTYSWK